MRLSNVDIARHTIRLLDIKAAAPRPHRLTLVARRWATIEAKIIPPMFPIMASLWLPHHYGSS